MDECQRYLFDTRGYITIPGVSDRQSRPTPGSSQQCGFCWPACPCSLSCGFRTACVAPPSG